MSKHDDLARGDLAKSYSNANWSAVRNVERSKVAALQSIAASLIEANRLARLATIQTVLEWAQNNAQAAVDAGEAENAEGYIEVMKMARDAVKELVE